MRIHDVSCPALADDGGECTCLISLTVPPPPPRSDAPHRSTDLTEHTDHVTLAVNVAMDRTRGALVRCWPNTGIREVDTDLLERWMRFCRERLEPVLVDWDAEVRAATAEVARRDWVNQAWYAVSTKVPLEALEAALAHLRTMAVAHDGGPIDMPDDAALNERIDALHGPGAADALDAAIADGSIFGDMPNEDHLAEALTEAAREAGQCGQWRPDGKQCFLVSGHTGDHVFG